MIPPARILKTLRGAREAKAFYRQAKRRGLPGGRFFSFGRKLGWRELISGRDTNPLLLRVPVSITRYYEFDFADRMLEEMPKPPARCLDLSSPRLFSLYRAANHTPQEIWMLNPDSRDLEQTEKLTAHGNFRNLHLIPGTEQNLPGHVPESFDAIWSISVIEHILTPEGDERDTLRRLWDLLRPGGRLILTIPVDTEAWDEYRDHDPYGTQASDGKARHFFCRFYDEDSIQDRIVQTLGVAPLTREWFGEKEKGHFHAYIEDWTTKGRSVTLRDPLLIAEHYRMYPSFGEMPGAGICGLCFVKPEQTPGPGNPSRPSLSPGT